MECPRCTGRLARLRTVDGGRVIRYNRCLSCGARFKSIEILMEEYQEEISNSRSEAIRAYRRAEEANRSLETISQAFGSVRDALRPLQVAQEMTDSGLHSLTGLHRRRSGFLSIHP